MNYNNAEKKNSQKHTSLKSSLCISAFPLPSRCPRTIILCLTASVISLRAGFSSSIFAVSLFCLILSGSVIAVRRTNVVHAIVAHHGM